MDRLRANAHEFANEKTQATFDQNGYGNDERDADGQIRV
jgi:hypothetical protein